MDPEQGHGLHPAVSPGGGDDNQAELRLSSPARPPHQEGQSLGTSTARQPVENLPSMGVLGSGRLANTTSTYSSCSRSKDAFRPGGGQEELSPLSQTFLGPLT